MHRFINYFINNNLISFLKACPNNCLKCQILDQSMNCTFCQPNFYLFQDPLSKETTCVRCNNSGNFIYNNSQCLICDPNCKNCFNENQCSECLSGFYLTFSKKFSSSCPIGFYADNSSKTCLLCDKNCQSCFGPSNIQCYDCQISSFKFNNQCLDSCPLNTSIGINNSCTSCLNNCQICSKNQTKKCYKCIDNFFLLGFDNGSQICSNCLQPGAFIVNNTWCVYCTNNCLTCQSENQCLQCQNPYLNVENQGICVLNCPFGYYLDMLSQLCKSCPFTCSSCVSNQNCTNCSSPFLFFDFKCLAVCPINTTNVSNHCQSIYFNLILSFFYYYSQ